MIPRPDLSAYDLRPPPRRPALGISFVPFSFEVQPGGWMHGVRVSAMNPGRFPDGRVVVGDVLLGFNGFRVDSTACLGAVLATCETHHDYEAVILRRSEGPVSTIVGKVTIDTQDIITPPTSTEAYSS